MSDTVSDHYTEDDFETLIDNAESNAANDWEEEFVADMNRPNSVRGPALVGSFGGHAASAARWMRQRRSRMLKICASRSCRSC